MPIKKQKPALRKDSLLPNFFQCPNVLVDDLIQHISGAELKCYLVIIRKTTGWHKLEDRISISQFVELTGLSNRSVIDSCAKLANLGLISIVKDDHANKFFTLKNIANLDLTSEKTSHGEKSSHSEKTSQPPVKKVHTPCEKTSQVASEKSSHTKDTLTKDTIQKTLSKEICRDVAIADTATDISTKVEPTKKPKLTPEETEANKATWTAYATAYKNRYGVEPLRNAQVNGIISKFVKAVSQEDAPSIARFFINISNQYYVLKLHDIKIMLADAGAIRTQWLTNRTVTTSQARQADTMQTAKSSVDGVLERRAKRQAEAMGDIINGECTHV